MADEEGRRGDLNVAEAAVDTPAPALNGDTITSHDDENIESKPAPDSVKTEDSPAEDVTPTQQAKDSEEAREKLARMKEELLRAKEESARARDEVEKAKKELEVAKDMQEDQATVKIEKAADEAPPAPAEEPKVTKAPAEETPKTHETPTEELQAAEAEIRNEALDETPTVEPKAAEAEINPVKEEIKEEVIQAEPANHEAPQEDVNNEDAGIEEGEEASECLDEEEEELAHSDEGVEIEGEREEGDGEESDGDDAAAAPAKPLDDDEDKRNPQYIPKKGGFYEHDDRTREEGEEPAPAEEPATEEKPKKAMRSEGSDRWGHDMFDPDQQGPKSNDELVNMYGYDIRQEEGAPRARRRRRYGRGPNKYDRTWEDEEAYSRPRGGGRGGVGRGAGPPRGGGPRGGGDSTGRPERTDENPAPRPRTVRQDAPRREEFPPLSGGPQQREERESGPNTSSGNWRDNATANNAGGNRRDHQSSKGPVSFRRGGGGRTFEERNKPGAKGPRRDAQDSGDAESAPRETLNRPRNNHPSSGDEAGQRAPQQRPSNRGGGPSGGRGSFQSRGGGGQQRQSGGDSNNWERSEGAVGGSEPQRPSRGRGRGQQRYGSGRTMEGNRGSDIVSGMDDVRIHDDQSSKDPARSKRYSSQRQRITTPPPSSTTSSAPSSGAVPNNPPYGGSAAAAYYATYNASPPPGYVPQPTALLPLVAAQNAGGQAYGMGYPAAPPTQAAFSPGPYQPYPGPAPAPPPNVPVGVPIGSPTQDNLYGGGIMYYDPGRQPIHHHHPGPQPTRRAKAAIPIVAPDNEAMENYIMSNRRPQS